MKNNDPKLLEQKARHARLRRLRAIYNGTLTRKHRPVVQGFIFSGLPKKPKN